LIIKTSILPFQQHTQPIAESPTHRSTAEAELLTELTFRGKSVAGLEKTLRNLGRQKIL